MRKIKTFFLFSLLLIFRDKCRTYSSTRLTRGTRVSWEADRTLQTDRDTQRLIWTHIPDSVSTAALPYLILHQSWLSVCLSVCVCVSVELTYRVTLGTIISRGSAPTGGSSSSWWAGFSLLTRLSSGTLRKNASQPRHRERYMTRWQ